MDLSELRKRFEDCLKLKKDELNRQKKEARGAQDAFNRELQEYKQLISQYESQEVLLESESE